MADRIPPLTAEFDGIEVTEWWPPSRPGRNALAALAPYWNGQVEVTVIETDGLVSKVWGFVTRDRDTAARRLRGEGFRPEGTRR